MNGFVSLLWREWRRERALVFMAVALFAVLLPPSMRTVPMPRDGDWPLYQRRMTPRGTFENWSLFDEKVAIVRFQAALVAAMVGAVILPFLAAHALAGERADRSAEFIAPLPLSRVCRLAAKVVLPAAVALATWGPIVAIATSSRRAVSSPADDLPILCVMASFTLLATALAWSLGAWIASTVIAAGMGIALPVVAVPMVLFGVLPAAGVAPRIGGEAFHALWIGPGGSPSAVTIGIAIALFAVGSILFVLRRE